MNILYYGDLSLCFPYIFDILSYYIAQKHLYYPTCFSTITLTVMLAFSFSLTQNKTIASVVDIN